MSDNIYMELCQPTWMPCNHTLRITKDLVGSVEGVPCPYCLIAALEKECRSYEARDSSKHIAAKLGLNKLRSEG